MVCRQQGREQRAVRSRTSSGVPGYHRPGTPRRDCIILPTTMRSPGYPTGFCCSTVWSMRSPLPIATSTVWRCCFDETASRTSMTASAIRAGDSLLVTLARCFAAAVAGRHPASGAIVVVMERPEGAGELARDPIELVSQPLQLDGGPEIHRREHRHQPLSRQCAGLPWPRSAMPTQRCTKSNGGGRNTFRFRNEELTRLARDRLELEAAGVATRARGTGGLLPAQLRACDNALCGVEALREVALGR